MNQIQIRCIYRRLDRCTDTDLTGASIVITVAEFLSLSPYKIMEMDEIPAGRSDDDGVGGPDLQYVGFVNLDP